jgi:hypothetical protein
MANRWDRRAPGELATTGASSPVSCCRGVSAEPVSGARKGIAEPGSWSHPVIAACPQFRLSARRRPVGTVSRVGEAKVLPLRYVEARAPAEPVCQPPSSARARASCRTGPEPIPADGSASSGRSVLRPCTCAFSPRPAPPLVIVAVRLPLLVLCPTLRTLGLPGIVTIEDSLRILPALGHHNGLSLRVHSLCELPPQDGLDGFSTSGQPRAGDGLAVPAPGNL